MRAIWTGFLACAVAVAFAQWSRAADPSSGTISTIVGNGAPGYSGDGGAATAASLVLPRGVALDVDGNLFIADPSAQRVLKVSASGMITTVAGTGRAGFSGDGGPASKADLYNPVAVVVDRAGNVLIADSYNDRIRKVSPTGTITTVAGNGVHAFAGDGGPAILASLATPSGVAFDAVGSLLIADTNNQVVRRVLPDGTILTVAGHGSNFPWGFSGDGGPATAATMRNPRSVAIDGSGNLLIADTGNHRIRKVDTRGTITTVAGVGDGPDSGGYSGDGGPATSASLNLPVGIAIDSGGNVLFADSINGRIRRVDPSGTITTVAGNGHLGFSGDDGVATLAALNQPAGIVIDGTGNMLIADTNNRRIRRVAGAAVIQAPPGMVPVILVHGYAGSPDSFGALGQVLTEKGIQIGPPFDYSAWTPRKSAYPASVEELAGMFHEHLQRVLIDTNVLQVDVVAHSMGGLVARAYMSGLAVDSLGAGIAYGGEIRRLVTVGTPNYGTKASFGAGLTRGTQRGEMAVASRFVLRLHDAWAAAIEARAVDESAVLAVAGIAGFGAEGDRVVLPSSAVLPRAFLAAPTAQVRYLPLAHSGDDGIAYVESETHPLVALVETFLSGETPTATYLPEANDWPRSLLIIRGLGATGESDLMRESWMRVDGRPVSTRSLDGWAPYTRSRAVLTYLLGRPTPGASHIQELSFRLPKKYEPVTPIEVDRSTGLPIVIDVVLRRRQ